MSPTQGFFENDNDYSERVVREANERTIENATGSKPSQGLFESTDSYRERIAQETNERIVEKSTGTAPAQGFFENNETYSNRLSLEANEQTVTDATGSAPSQGLFENDNDYEVRVRKEANEQIVREGSGSAARQGFLESSYEYRSRIAHEAREIRADERPTAALDGSRPNSPRSSSSSSSGEGSASSSGSSAAFWVALVLLVAVVTIADALRKPSPSTGPLRCVGAPANDTQPWIWNSRILGSFPTDRPAPKFVGAFAGEDGQHELLLLRDAKGVFGELRSPVLEADSPTSRLYSAHLDPGTGVLKFSVRFGDGERHFVGSLRPDTVTGRLQHGQQYESVRWPLVTTVDLAIEPFATSRAAFECFQTLAHRY